jgi:hypothetical protein
MGDGLLKILSALSKEEWEQGAGRLITKFGTK